MMRLSAFADEISPDLDEQLEVLSSHGISHIDLRSVWSTNVLDLSPDQLDSIERSLAARRMGVAAIGSPIGKVPITASLDEEAARLRSVCAIAQRFGARAVRMFSFYIPKGEDAAQCESEVIRRMQTLTAVAQQCDVVLTMENEHGLFGDLPERCHTILESVNSPHLRLCFDSGNFVYENVRPFEDAYSLLADYVGYVHVKDGTFGNDQAVPVGNGDGGYDTIIADLARRGYDGVLSLEPHLSAGGTFGGFSGPELFGTAIDALVTLLDDLGVPWQ